jgi:hypothetical protein
MKISRSNSPTVRTLTAVIVAILCIGLGIQVAEGAKSKTLGRTPSSPRPMCPEKKVPPAQATVKDFCEVTGQVTGFQRSADGKQGLFKVKKDGKIVAWSVDLSDPRKSERKTFGKASQTNQFGKAPTAGISIIRATDGSDFKLKSASPVISVRRYYKQKPVITLDKPLRVRKGDVVALTTATWLPAFTRIGQKPSDEWVGSRKKSDWTDGKSCNLPNNLNTSEERLKYFFDHSAPQRKIGSERPYQCVYKGARILYWAYFVPKN